MTYARQRQDLLDDGLFIPLKFRQFKQQQITEWLLCLQPDELDNAEFNLILIKNGEVYDVGMSIDFDFKESA